LFGLQWRLVLLVLQHGKALQHPCELAGCKMALILVLALLEEALNGKCCEAVADRKAGAQHEAALMPASEINQ
jgi:hypothetical protein